MIDENSTARVVTVMQNCAKQLRWAHRDLSEAKAPVDPLTKIDGVAGALEQLAGDVQEALARAGRTVGGLTDEVRRLRGEQGALNSRGIERI